MRFLFLNQYGPPDPAPTARLLGELAGFLRERGHEVEIVAPSRTYHGRPARGRHRLRREVAALGAIWRAGWHRRTPAPDVVLALSSPPGLLVVAALLARRHRARLAHWAMDLYPELARALGETGPGVVFRAVQRAMRWAYRRCALVVALDEDMQAHLQETYAVRNVRVQAPWPSLEAERQLAAADSGAAASGDLWTWLYSGNLGRAHEWRTLLDAQGLLESRGVAVSLVFQGDGAARPAAMAYAASLGVQRCAWRGYVAEADLIGGLLAARLLVVTQREVTRGLLWPSKLAIVERLARPLLYVGPPDGAIARRLRPRPGTGVFAPGQAEEVAAWVASCRNGAISCDEGGPPPAANGGTEGCRRLETWLLGTASPRPGASPGV